MAKRGDKIEAAVNSVVNDVSTIETAFIMEVALKLVINVTDNGAETGWSNEEVNTGHCSVHVHSNKITNEHLFISIQFNFIPIASITKQIVSKRFSETQIMTPEQILLTKVILLNPS